MTHRRILAARVKARLGRFSREEQGSLAIETVILLPLLFWAYLSMFAIFDAYRQHAINQKAAFTLSDILSRQTTPIDTEFMEGMQDVLNYLTVSTGSETALRVSSIFFDADADEYKLDWSRERGWKPELKNSDVKNWHDRLPVMIDNEYLILVETFVKYNPPFATGLQERTISNFVFTSPRYGCRLLWTGAGSC